MKFVCRDDKAGKYPWHFVYFHCDCERYVDSVYNKNVPDDDWCAPDLVGGLQSKDEVPDGVHDCMVYNEPAILYLWTDEEPSYTWKFGGGKESWAGWEKTRRGLIVFRSDTRAVEYAEEKFLEKSRIL